jgi:hypothetical protein
MMESVIRAMHIAKATLHRCIGHTVIGAKKLLWFEDLKTSEGTGHRCSLEVEAWTD